MRTFFRRLWSWLTSWRKPKPVGRPATSADVGKILREVWKDLPDTEQPSPFIEYLTPEQYEALSEAYIDGNRTKLLQARRGK